MSKYVCRKRARFNSLSGNVNIPYGTAIDCSGNMLYLDGKPLCSDHSQNAHDYFSLDDDGRGLERGDLVGRITKLLERKDKDHQDRWDKIWGDETSQKYKRDMEDYWLWGHDFYGAPVEDLKHIANSIGA